MRMSEVTIKHRQYKWLPMAFITYILYSRKLRRFYVGYTTDMMKRLNQHNRGEGGYTQQGIPWSLIWMTSKPTRFEAESLEKKLKHLSHDRKIRFIKKNLDGMVDAGYLDLIE